MAQGPQQMPVSERLLKIIERVGILVALTFDSDQNETQNTTIYTSHIGKCTAICTKTLAKWLQ